MSSIYSQGGIVLKKKRELSWLERIYLVEILRGLWITSVHFWRNLGLHIAHRLGLFRHLRASVTYQYPDEMRPMASRLRTRHRLTQRQDGAPRCVACMMCETVCPARCIYIRANEHPDPNIEKLPLSFDIDLGKCVYCGYCVEACPEDAIRMDTQLHDIAAYSRDEMWLNIQDLLHPQSRPAGTISEKFTTFDLPATAQPPATPTTPHEP